MKFNKKEILKIKFYNSIYITFPLTDWIISFLSLFLHIIRSIFGGNPEPVGLTRLLCQACYYLYQGECGVKVCSGGIYCKGHLCKKPHYSMLKFLDEEGIVINKRNIKEMKLKFREYLLSKNPTMGRDYYRAIAMLSLNLVLLSSVELFFFYKIYLFFVDKEYFLAGMQLIICIVNLHLAIGTTIFYFGLRDYFYLQFTFTEATSLEEMQLKTAEKQPLVVTIIPSYMEEPVLIRRAIHSACLQNYGNHKVYLLLGNETQTTESDVLINTMEVKEVVDGLKKEFQSEHRFIDGYYQRFIAIKSFSKEEADKQLLILHEICNRICSWFEQKACYFSSDEEAYPTDGFFIENNLRFHQKYYHQKALKCLNFLQSPEKSEIGQFLKQGFVECSRVFAAEINVFMRMKYANLEHQSTKAANMTAFTSLLGKSWTEVKGKNGELLLKAEKTGMYFPKPDYLCVFDSDAVGKGNYLVRKVSYMEKHKVENVGLIQSLYRIAFPEFTDAASTSGLSTTWFIPMFMFYQSHNASFWMGFNGVFDYEAYQSVGTFMADTLTEDTEFSLKFRANGYKIVSSHEYQCQTMSPEDLRSIRTQRVRWSSGGITIAKQLHQLIKQKKIKFNNALEAYYNYSYILGLSLLATSILLIWLISSPFSYQYFGMEYIPFFMYLFTYAFFYPQVVQAKGSVITLIHGFVMNLYLQVTYIEGLLTGILQNCFKGSKFIFKPTARKKSSKRQVNNFGVITMILLTVWNGIPLYLSYKDGFLYNIFPVFQIICIVWINCKFILRNKRESYPIDMKDRRYKINYESERKSFNL